MKITKTLDVSDCSDEAISVMHKLMDLPPSELDDVLKASKEVRQVTDVSFIIQKVVELLEQPNVFQIKPRELASAVRQVAAHSGIKIA